MAIAIKLCSLVIVGLIALSHFTVSAAEQKSTPQNDLTSAPSERLFDLSSWVNRNPYYTYNTRPYYNTGGYYPNNNRYPYYSNTNGGYYPNNNGWNNINSGWNNNNGYYPNTGGYGGGFGGNGGYGGFGGNGGLTTYYGYGRDDYYGDRNMGFGYQQGTNANGFSREGDQNLNTYNSYPSSATPSPSSSSSGYYY